MANIRDIAKRSHYAISTVSRAINHSGYVSKTAQAKIDAVIKELDYVPNAMGQKLSYGKSQIIGVVMPQNDTRYFTRILSSIVDAAAQQDTHILLLTSGYQTQRERDFLEMLRRHAVDALIFLSHELPITAISQYQKYGPIVLGEATDQSRLSAAYSQRQASEIQALKWIMATYQPRSIGFLFRRPVAKSGTSRSWLSAYAKVCAQLPEPQIVTAVDAYENAYQAMAKFSTMPDYLIANSDETAAGALQYCQMHHLHLLGVLGQEREPIGEVLGLPTIDHHFDALGRKLFALATSPAIQHIAIPATFIAKR